MISSSQRDARQKAIEAAAAKWRWIALSLMLIGLMLLGARLLMRATAPEYAEKGWSEAEQREFKELQTLLHKSPGMHDQDMSQVYKRMDDLDALRLGRRDSAATRDWWLRFVGVGLALGGLGVYFASRPAND